MPVEINRAAGQAVRPGRISYRFESASMWAWRFHVHIDRGAEPIVAEVSLSSLKNQGRIEVGGLAIEMVGKGWFSPVFSFRRNGQVIATGSVPLAFKTRMFLESGGRQFEMRPRAFGDSFEISEGGHTVGHIQKKGLLSRRGTIETADDIPAYDALFLLMLASHYWRMVAVAVYS